MGRAYAGVLGPVAFLVVLAREFPSAGASSTTLWHAWLALVTFAVIGSAVGMVAGWIVDDSAHSQVSAELAASAATAPPAKKPA